MPLTSPPYPHSPLTTGAPSGAGTKDQLPGSRLSNKCHILTDRGQTATGSPDGVAQGTLNRAQTPASLPRHSCRPTEPATPQSHTSRCAKYQDRRTQAFHFFLEGEFPIWEYESPEDSDGELVILKGGYYLERLPGSIHGIEAEPTSPVGSMVLIWRTDTGNFVNEPNAKEESIEVPYPDR